MMKRNPGLLVAAVLALTCVTSRSFAQTVTVFSDSFTSASAWTLTAPAGLIGSAANGKIRIRDGNGTLGTTASARYAQYAKTAALTASGAYNPVLRNSTADLEWYFAFTNSFGTSTATPLAGVVTNSAGDAQGFVVAASNSDFRNAGVGYAVTVSDNKRLSLVRYSGGLAGTVTSLITWTTTTPSDTGLSNVGAKTIVVRLRYVPATEQWTLSGAAIDSGNAYTYPFPDPITTTYTAADTQSVIDGTHTGQSLGNLGLTVSSDNSAPQIYLDNLTLRTVASSLPVEVPIYTDSFINTASWTSVRPATGFTAGVAGDPDPKYRIRDSGTPGTTSADRFAYARFTNGLQTSSSGGFNPTLRNALATQIQWSFAFGGNLTNLTSNNLGGNPVNGSGDAMGVVIAASDPDVRSAGSGYAVVVAENRLKFIRYTGGLAGTVTELLGWTAADASTGSLHAIGNRAVHCVLTYTRATDTWQLKAGATTANLYSGILQQPREAAYDPTTIKSVVDATYVTTALPQLALFASTDNTVGQYIYDNLGLYMTVPKALTATLNLTQTTGGTLNTAATTTYEVGSRAVLQATPAAGYWFRGWTGGGNPRANPLPLTFSGDLSLQAVFEPVPAPAMAVGTNLTQPKDWVSNYPFTDLFSQMRVWLTATHDGSGGAFATGFSAEIPVNADGWPTQVPFLSSTGVLQDVHTLLTAGLPESGTYLLTWEGEGTFKIDVQNNQVGGTRYQATLTPTSTKPGTFHGDRRAILAIRITSSNPANPLRNIRIIRPGYATTYTTDRLHAGLQNRLVEFGCSALRFMDWGGTNGSELITWSQRTRPATYVQTRDVAFEHMITTCNLQQADMWVCVPHKADDTFITNLARLIRYGSDGVNPYTSVQTNPVYPPLDPGLRVFIEYSNETWNTDFAQTSYAITQGTALGYGVNSGDKFVAHRSAEIWTLFDAVFTGQSNRVVRVLATQAANTVVTTRRLAALSDPAINPNLAWPDVLAFAPYYGKNYTPTDITANGYPTEADLEAVADSSIEVQRTQTAAHWNMCRSAGLQLVCYEGGQHYSGRYAALSDSTLSARFHDYFVSPAIYDDYLNYMDMLKVGHVSLFVHFAFIQRYDPTKAAWWTILDELDTPTNQSPRYQALLDWMAANPTP
ncbi:InlB B-repeat-containing protein [Rariglobus hedericola]|uniref:Bacterial repeat domain-containing protein n=1 Tax=Rariglobus hedericola TaxID=2597822 RepID=A0A556QPK8_9BACT|nr:hypothetical protein [Rariglobus hedericola]TSJ78532.1 hypothetical protein FPL22_04325 [Rariglobus hedericola]